MSSLPAVIALSVFAPLVHQDEKSPPPPPADFAIVGARVETVLGEPLPVGTVVVRDGRIVSVTSGRDAPAGLATIEARGLILYPGFVDAYTGRGVKQPSAPTTNPARPDANVTAHASMWLENRKGIAPEWRAGENLEFEPDTRAYQAGVTLGFLAPTRGGMRGQGAVVEYLPPSVEERVLVPTYGSGMSFRVAAGQGYPSNLLGALALLRQTLLDAQAVRDGVTLWEGDETPAWAKSLEALQPVVQGSTLVFFEANQAREVERAIRLAEEFGLKLAVVGGREAGEVAELLGAKKIPVVLTDDLGAEPSLEGSADTPAADATPPAVRRERHERWAKSASGAEALAMAGVPFAFSSEGSSGGLLKAVRARVARGLDKGAALRALTLGGAQVLGLEKEVGAVAPRYRANLVLMSGDFADESSEVVRVWVGSRAVYVAQAGQGGSK